MTRAYSLAFKQKMIERLTGKTPWVLTSSPKRPAICWCHSGEILRIRVNDCLKNCVVTGYSAWPPGSWYRCSAKYFLRARHMSLVSIRIAQKRACSTRTAFQSLVVARRVP